MNRTTNVNPARWLTWFLVLFLGLANAYAQEHVNTHDETIEFITGRKLDAKNRLAMSAFWNDAELKPRLRSYAQTQKIGLWLDRRVDPRQSVQLGVNDRTNEQVLWKLAEANQLGVCRIESLYYFGPYEAAARLPVLIENLHQENLKHRKKYQVSWTATSSLRTEPVVNPADLLKSLADEHGFTIEGLDSLPHDVWSKVEIPETSLAAQVQLLLIGFSKTYQRDQSGKSITLVDLPPVQSAKRRFDIPVGVPAKEIAKLIEKIESRISGLRLRRLGKQLEAVGDLEKLRQMEALLVSAQVPDGVDGTEKTYTLAKTTAFRETLLRSIAQQSGLELDAPAELQTLLQQRVTIEVNEVSLEELIFEVLKGSGLKGTIQAGKLEVHN